MTNFTLQKTNLYDKNPAGDCGCKKQSYYDLDQGTYARGSSRLQHSVANMKTYAAMRYNTKPILSVGDTIEVFEIPSYAYLKDLSVFHDCPLGDFRFEVEVADVVDGDNCLRTVTKRAGVQAIKDTEAGTAVPVYGTALAALPVIGAAVGRTMLHFGDAVRNNHRAVVRIKITAAPAAPAAGAAPAANFFDLPFLDFHAKFEEYAHHNCAAKCQGAYNKDAVAV
jgi:hypothetical protein